MDFDLLLAEIKLLLKWPFVGLDAVLRQIDLNRLSKTSKQLHLLLNPEVLKLCVKLLERKSICKEIRVGQLATKNILL